MEIDEMEDELEGLGEGEEAEVRKETYYGSSDTYDDNSQMLRELLDMVSMMGSMQREMMATNARLNNLTTCVSNLEVTSKAQSTIKNFFESFVKQGTSLEE